MLWTELITLAAMDGWSSSLAPAIGSAAGTDIAPRQLWGIALALTGAILMSVGTQYQSRGMGKVSAQSVVSTRTGLGLGHLLSLLRRPSWLVGTGMLILAVLLQIGSLSLAPLMVVQPLGVVALVVTAVLNARISGFRLTRGIRLSIALCVVGIAVFVSIAAFVAVESRVTALQVTIVLVLFAAVTTGLIVLYFALRHRGSALFYVFGAGVLYAFVATFAKLILSRALLGQWDVLTWMSVGGLALGALVGMVFVQNAHASGPPDLVIAGLTVIDPIVAVIIGMFVLQEAVHASLLAMLAFLVTGMVATIGVIGVERLHPQTAQLLDTARPNPDAEPPKG